MLFDIQPCTQEIYEYNCTGDFCYMSQYGPNLFTRGCLSIVDDSLAKKTVEVIRIFVQYIKHKNVEMGTFGYLSLNYYLCNEDLCNLEDVGVHKMVLESFSNITFLSFKKLTFLGGGRTKSAERLQLDPKRI